MTSEHDLQRRIEDLERQRQRIDDEIESLREASAIRRNQFDQCRIEQHDVAQKMDHWTAASGPFPESPLAVYFLGPVSGEWAAQSRYRGDLPGFGGFLVVAGGLNIVVDPGRSTLAHLHAANIHPRTIDLLIATHTHWDCVRDLPLLIRSATHAHISAERTGPPRLRLLAPAAVLRGQPTVPGTVVEHHFFQTSGSVVDTVRQLAEFPVMNGPEVNIFDLFMRLRGQFETLEIGRRYELSRDVEMRTRRSFHGDTFGVEYIPALDILVQAHGAITHRCVYLSDTEYRPTLVDEYARDELRPIDILICNVKTLDLQERAGGELKGYTARHLGWNGLIQLTRDFLKRGLLTERSKVVLRAWGIETVTRLDAHDGVMTAAPEKLRVYEEAYLRETGLAPVVPGQTWVAVADDDRGAPTVRHVRYPYPEEGTFQRFGPIWYCSEVMAQIVRDVRPVVDSTDEVLMITGESGTGKDALAHGIHGKGKLHIVNAGEFKLDNFWASLKGYSKGAYTGAERDTDGWLTDPSTTTLLIQEIGDMPVNIQSDLLTLLGERKYRRLGDGEEYDLHTRVIMTTNKDIAQSIADGTFNAALHFRILRHVRMPPLRERPEDIPAIVHGLYIEDPKRYRRLDKAAIELLQSYPWPGNVRSLRHVLWRLSREGDWSLDAIRREIEIEHGAHSPQVKARQADALDLDERKLLELIRDSGLRRRRDFEENWGNGKKKGGVLNVIKRLRAKGLLRMVGNGPNARYELQ